MAESFDELENSLLSRANDGFLPLDEIIEAATLQVAKVEKYDLSDLMQESPDANSPTVLVVDDDDAIRTVLTRQLSRRGFRATAVSGVDEAWVSIRSSLPNAIITDVRMPGTNGLQFLRQLIERHPDTVVIVTSGSPDIETTIAALRDGATDFLVKPMDFSALFAALERGLERRRVRLDQRRYQLNLEQVINERTRVISENIQLLNQRNREISLAYRDVVVRLGRASEWRDDETGEHIQRIGMFSAAVARQLGLSRADIDTIAEASPMHDIGKIGVPDSILLKPGKLTPMEYEYMKSHTVIGAEILSGSEAPLLQCSEIIALSHHEWFNGSGYPFGKKGDEIPLFGRIVACVDVYDALIHERTYKKAVPLDEAVEIMSRRRGTQFDPAVFDSFLDCVDELVRLEVAMAQRPARKTKYDVEIGLLKMTRRVEETWTRGVS